MGNLFDLLKEPGKYTLLWSRPLFCEVWIACFHINWSSKIKVLSQPYGVLAETHSGEQGRASKINCSNGILGCRACLLTPILSSDC